MLIRVGLENNVEGRSIAWALDLPGCYAAGQDDSEALLRVPPAVVAYANRIARRAQRPWLDLGDFDVRLVEVWNGFTIDDQYELAAQGRAVNAWFRSDWKPLAQVEIEHGLALLSWGREDLLAAVKDLPGAQLDREYPGERWSIRGILRHVAGAEWWYLDRLDLAGLERPSLPVDVFERLAAVRARLAAVLPGLAGQERVRGSQGEFWSPRKLLRRAIWHELDHIGHISRLILAG